MGAEDGRELFGSRRATGKGAVRELRERSCPISHRGSHDQASDQERRTRTLGDRWQAVGCFLARDEAPDREARPTPDDDPVGGSPQPLPTNPTRRRDRLLQHEELPQILGDHADEIGHIEQVIRGHAPGGPGEARLSRLKAPASPPV